MTVNKSPSRGFLFYLAGLSMLGYLAIDMYLPAFGMMQDSLNSTASAISASLSIFLVGFASCYGDRSPIKSAVSRSC